MLPVHHLGPCDDDVYDDGGRHQERGRGAGDGENIPVALFSETVLKGQSEFILKKEVGMEWKLPYITSSQSPQASRGGTVSRSEITSRNEAAIKLFHLSL